MIIRLYRYMRANKKINSFLRSIWLIRVIYFGLRKLYRSFQGNVSIPLPEDCDSTQQEGNVSISNEPQPEKIDCTQAWSLEPNFFSEYGAKTLSQDLNNWLSNDNYKNYCIINLFGFGDAYLILKYVEAFCGDNLRTQNFAIVQSTQKPKRLVMLMPRKFKGLYELFEYDVNIKVQYFPDHLVPIIRNKLEQTDLKYDVDSGKIIPLHPNYLNGHRYDLLPMSDQIDQKRMYSIMLSGHTMLEEKIPYFKPHTEPENIKSNDKLNICIIPFANSMEPVPLGTFEHLAKNFEAVGHNVIWIGGRSENFPDRAANYKSLNLVKTFKEIAKNDICISAMTGLGNVVADLQLVRTMIFLTKEVNKEFELKFSDKILFRNSYPYVENFAFNADNFTPFHFCPAHFHSLTDLNDKILDLAHQSNEITSMGSEYLIKTHVSPGELLDKLSILRVKENNCDTDQLRSIERQIQLLAATCDFYELTKRYKHYYQKLIDINSEAWDENESIYTYFNEGAFDVKTENEKNALIKSMSKAQHLNRKRVEMKNLIDQNYFQSNAMIENKSFNGAKDVH